MKKLKFSHYLLAGLTFLLPLGVLVAVLLYIHEKFASAIRDFYVPIYKNLGVYDKLPRHVMAVGAELVTVAVGALALAVVGWIVLRVLRRRRIKAFHQFLGNVPVIKTVFSPVKRAVDSLFGSGLNDGNRKVVRFAYPAEPYKTIGIVMDEVVENGEKKYLVLLPLTMSAGTGILLTIPKAAAEEIPVNVSRALEHVISCGMVKLPTKKGQVLHRDGIRISGIYQLWEAIQMGEPIIELRMSEEERAALPADKDKLISFFCKAIYARVAARAKTSMKHHTNYKVDGLVHRLVHMKWYYAKELRNYTGEVVDDEFLRLTKIR